MCIFSFTKPRAKYQVPWEILAVKKKRDDMKTAPLCNRRFPNNANSQKLKTAKSELNNAYLKEQTGYVEDRINKIRDHNENRQSGIAWQAVNVVSRRKSAAKATIKVGSPEKQIHLLKKHFKNLFRKCAKISNETITKILGKQLDFKLEQFTQEELDVVFRRIKKWKNFRS